MEEWAPGSVIFGRTRTGSRYRCPIGLGAVAVAALAAARKRAGLGPFAFQNGDIVAKLVLTVPGGAPIEASSQKSSGQGAAHFPPVSARSHEKWDMMVHFELGAGRTWQSLKEDGATLVCRIFDTDIFTEDDLLGSVELSGATLHAKANTEEVVAAKVILGTGVKTENGDPVRKRDGRGH